jgi:hypothetical protein
LPDVIEERLLVDVLVRGHGAPELARAQVAVLEERGVDGRFDVVVHGVSEARRAP